MNAVDIDAYNDKHTVAILRPWNETVCMPFDVPHDVGSLERLANQIIYLDRVSRALIEATG